MKLLIFINPVSGNGNSVKLFYEFQKYIAKEHAYTVIKTTSKNFIKDYFNNNLLFIKGFDVLISVGGDGLAYELLNETKVHNIDPIFAEIPTGSSNGYFKSLTFDKKIPNTKNKHFR